jgi:FKBP-type peptidyl-prolyl cis-trans isomerase
VIVRCTTQPHAITINALCSAVKVGERAYITATPDFAYGAGGFPTWGIQPNSTLKFDIEVLSIG